MFLLEIKLQSHGLIKIRFYSRYHFRLKTEVIILLPSLTEPWGSSSLTDQAENFQWNISHRNFSWDFWGQSQHKNEISVTFINSEYSYLWKLEYLIWVLFKFTLFSFLNYYFKCLDWHLSCIVWHLLTFFHLVYYVQIPEKRRHSFSSNNYTQLILNIVAAASFILNF